jgi:PBSX family phage terminase large subunit
MAANIPTDVEAISTYGAELDSSPPPSFTPHASGTWRPKLNPTQDLIFDDLSKFILAYGERGSGKSIGALHKLVRHCYENFNALGVIIVGVRRQALEGGAWHKLITDILPQWKEGTGLEFTESKTNTAKDDFLFMSNRFGGWSKILLLSMPVDNFIADRAKGMEPSFILVEEIQTLQSDKYFSVLVQQLGRRPHISTVQQYVATCNPEGPSHWVYKRFFTFPVDPETGEWNLLYKTYHVPISENLGNLPEGYYQNVLEAVKDDPVEYRRMVLGEWVDRPSGDAIFKGYFSEALHVRGDAVKGTRILPKAGYDIVLGYDLGSANSAIAFLQNIPTQEKDLWILFDEMVYTDAYIPYTALVPAIMRRIAFWNETCATKFNVFHISDASAFNMFRATDGTYDSLEVERISRESQPSFPDVEVIKMVPCPKFQGSVAARVKTTMKYLNQERFLVSASCTKSKDMFNNLESEKPKDNKYIPDLPFQPRRSKHLHIFDAISYALLFFELGQTPLNIKNVAPPELMFLGTKR